MDPFKLKIVQAYLFVSTLLVFSLFTGNRSIFASAGYDSGFAVISDNGEFSMKVNGFTQSRFTAYSPAHADSQNNFNLGLGRVALSGKAFDSKASYFMQIEGSTFGNTNNISFIDWWTQYTVSPLLSVTTGRFILPYSRQFYTHPGNLLFTDLSAPDYAFDLPRAIGVMAGGSESKVSYGIGVVNGVKALDGAPGENNPPGDELSVFGRVELAILEPYGYMESAAKIVEKPALSVGVAAARNEIDYASGFQNVSIGDKTNNLTVDAGFRYQAFTAQGAYYLRSKSPADEKLENSNDFGFYAQAGYQIVPEKLEIAARLAQVDFEYVSTTTEYTGGLNYYISGHGLKVQVDYSLINKKLEGASESTNDHQLRAQTQILF